jgi:hypothetical protein
MSWKLTSMVDFIHHLVRPESTLSDEEKKDMLSSCNITDGATLSKNGCDKVSKALKGWWPTAQVKMDGEVLTWWESKKACFEEEVEKTRSVEVSFDFGGYSTVPSTNSSVRIRQHSLDEIFSASNCLHHKGTVLQYANMVNNVIDPRPDDADACAALLASGAPDSVQIPAQIIKAMEYAFVSYMVRCPLYVMILTSYIMCNEHRIHVT